MLAARKKKAQKSGHRTKPWKIEANIQNGTENVGTKQQLSPTNYLSWPIEIALSPVYPLPPFQVYRHQVAFKYIASCNFCSFFLSFLDRLLKNTFWSWVCFPAREYFKIEKSVCFFFSVIIINIVFGECFFYLLLKKKRKDRFLCVVHDLLNLKHFFPSPLDRPCFFWCARIYTSIFFCIDSSYTTSTEIQNKQDKKERKNESHEKENVSF